MVIFPAGALCLLCPVEDYVSLGPAPAPGGAVCHEAMLDGGHLASGVYLVRLEAEGVVHATQKVLLLR